MASTALFLTFLKSLERRILAVEKESRGIHNHILGGIKKASAATGDLIIHDLEGKKHNAGRVKGEKGEPGKDGDNGKDGNKIFVGQGVPQNIGNNGDIYIDLITGNVWENK